MQNSSALLEILRWGHAQMPGIIFYYSQELDLDMEDIGILSTVFYAFESKCKPLFQTGVNAGQVLQGCPALTKNKLSRKLIKLNKLGLIKIADENGKNFADRIIYLEPLMEKLEALVNRDHPQFSAEINNSESFDMEKQLGEYRQLIEQLELELEEEKGKRLAVDSGNGISKNDANYRKLADFIASKTGNLMSVKMASELKKWLYDLNFQPEFLFCLLEMCFERNISNPRSITKIACDIKEYSINTVEGLELYFNKYTGSDQKVAAISQFDPDIAEFGNFTGIDMSAEARKMVYYKWRYDWRFSHKMIMKAGEVMCQRTRNGGLEYIDSVLKNWMAKEIRLVEDAEKEMEDYKNRNKKEKTVVKNSEKKKPNKQSSGDYEIYVPPASLK